MSKLFGGSKQKSKQQSTSTQTSQNLAFPWAQQQYQPQVTQGNQASSAISALLGLGGDSAAANTAMQNYQDSAGFQNTLRDGSSAITNNAAARGLLGSGSTLRRLTQFGQDTSQKYFSDYIAKLLGMSQLGQSAGGLITGAGNYSTGNSQSTGTSSGSSNSGGLGQFLGTALSMAPMLSDRRAKTDIERIGSNDGLGVYSFRYIGDPAVRRGYMADEVARLRPDALGPVVNGFQTIRPELLPLV